MQEAKRRFDEDAEFKTRSQLEVVKLQSGDEEDILLWKIFCACSEKMLEEVLNS